MEANYVFHAIRETEGCIQWIREWFEYRSGNAKGVVLGVSGGKDSTVVAGLLCKALGRERVLGLLMPNGIQRDIDDSRRICSFLQMPYRVVNIRAGFEGILTSMESIEAAATHSAYQETIEVPHRFTLSEHTKTNLAPRLRMAVLYAMGQEIGYRVAGTGNYSERYVGYATKWGDTACDFAPIAEFTTDEVIEVGRVLGLPADLLEKAPSDGLCGKTDEENLGFTYEQLNHYIKTGECADPKVKAKIDQRHQYGLHKVLPIEMYRKGNHK